MEMNRQSAASKKVAELYGDVMRRAGVIFGATGGVMGAALRTAAFVLEKKNPDVAVLYRDALGEPLSHRAHALLHTDQTTWSLAMEADAAD